jgi:hypothetical protein
MPWPTTRCARLAQGSASGPRRRTRADALIELAAADTTARHAIGAQGREWVYQHHDMTTLAERFLNALESIVK